MGQAGQKPTRVKTAEIPGSRYWILKRAELELGLEKRLGRGRGGGLCSRGVGCVLRSTVCMMWVVGVRIIEGRAPICWAPCSGPLQVLDHFVLRTTP